MSNDPDYDEYMGDFDPSLPNGPIEEDTLTANPYYHHCDVRDVDYSQAMKGEIKCEECGAIWRRTSRGWDRQPRPKGNR